MAEISDFWLDAPLLETILPEILDRAACSLGRKKKQREDRGLEAVLEVLGHETNLTIALAHGKRGRGRNAVVRNARNTLEEERKWGRVGDGGGTVGGVVLPAALAVAAAEAAEAAEAAAAAAAAARVGAGTPGLREYW
ncbi:hypothetical protein KM043_007387 [Ampulex compressa]|nr:hypothetical protein KM043_007387 [Ampulex compressa]